MCGCGFPSSVCWKTVGSPWRGLGILVKSPFTVYVRVSFWAVCLPPLVGLSLCPVPRGLVTVVSCSRFEMRKCGTSSFFLSSRLFWLFGVHWDSTRILGWVSYIWRTFHWDFGRDCTESIDGIGSYWHFHSMTSSSSPKRCVSICLCLEFLSVFGSVRRADFPLRG